MELGVEGELVQERHEATGGPSDVGGVCQARLTRWHVKQYRPLITHTDYSVSSPLITNIDNVDH